MMFMKAMSLLKFMKVNMMNKFKVTIASTIYYQAEVEAESIEDINTQFNNGDLDFTCWKEEDLDSNIFGMEVII